MTQKTEKNKPKKSYRKLFDKILICSPTLGQGKSLKSDPFKDLPEIKTIRKRLKNVSQSKTEVDPFKPEELDELSDVVNVGDKIVFHPVYAVELQYSLHQIIERGKTLYRMRRKDVFAVLA